MFDFLFFLPFLVVLSPVLGLDRSKFVYFHCLTYRFVVKTAQLDAPRDGPPLLTEDPRLRRYDRDPSGRWTLRNPMLDRCWRMWQGAVVTWDGQVVPCCFDKDAQHGMGQASNGAAFREIWQSERYQQFRASVFTHRAGIEMCRNCSEGTEVWA